MDVNWDRCVICQNDTGESLKCPLLTPGTSGEQTDAYTTFLKNVEQFRSIDALPVELSFGINENANTFASHSASWHKSCHLKFNNSKLAKAIKRQQTGVCQNPSPSKRVTLEVDCCLFCKKGKDEGLLHQVSTFDTDSNIRSMITELNDTQLLTRIIGGDLIAKEAKYHLACLVHLRNRYRSLTRKANLQDENTDEKLNECRSFVELSSYIRTSVKSGILLFEVSEIHSMYVNRLEELGINKQINKTSLKNKLLEHFPEAQEQFDGRHTVTIFNEGMRNMLREALKIRDFSENAVILSKAAAIVRKYIMNHQGFKFSGYFPAECQEDSLPASLKSLVSMILVGSNLQDQVKRDSQACLTIGQCIVYNSGTKMSHSTLKARHSKEPEPPF
ncbi:unnamed protein product [Phaedon cochleariae]|uniref:Uncharacterized protein n=1 Tax=Phaedon cochleariae TaxID=80249 RepID=A0A9N9SJJ0_PHACE|nr:unnamed protein product [Phaedon cochleariae]